MAEYKTKQRQLILDYLIKNRDIHVTADMLIKYFEFHGTPIGKTTVYRNLDRLVEENVVRKFLVDGASACYQYIPDNGRCKEHFHFRCSECEELFHIECELMNEIQEHIYTEHGFVIDSSKTVFYGICKKCSEKMRVRKKAGQSV